MPRSGCTTPSSTRSTSFSRSRARAVVALVALVVGGQAWAAQSPVSLTITVWPDERKPAQARTWTLRCGPAGGTLPRARDACRRLAKLGSAAFAPIPKDAVCTAIYGGPQLAFVRGRFGERKIWAKFRRRNGCEIARWDRLAFLFPARL